MTGITEFVDVVRRYCDWVEQAPRADDVLTAHRMLAELQHRIIVLPNETSDDEYVDADYNENWSTVRNRLSALPVDLYWKIFDVFAESEKPVCCELADDLADIYADLKEGLYFFDKGNEPEAVWRWRFSYMTHWGRHLTGAQTALHQYFADFRESKQLET